MKISTASLTSFLTLFILFLLTSIACADQPADSLKKDSPKYLSFYENVDGETIHWEANFLGEEITSIYKNGKRIPDDLVNDYKDKIYNQLDEMRFGSDRFSFKMPDIHIDLDDLNKRMKKFKEEFPEEKQHFEFHQFDDKKFKKKMEELEKKLQDLKPEGFKSKFDDEKFKEKMEKLEKELQEKLRGLENYKFHFEWKEDEDTEA